MDRLKRPITGQQSQDFAVDGRHEAKGREHQSDVAGFHIGNELKWNRIGVTLWTRATLSIIRPIHLSMLSHYLSLNLHNIGAIEAGGIGVQPLLVQRDK